MKEAIKKIINGNVSGEDMMDYIEGDLQEIVQNIATEIKVDKLVIVRELSDGKYKISLMDSKSSVDINAWESKEQFIEDIIDLFS